MESHYSSNEVILSWIKETAGFGVLTTDMQLNIQTLNEWLRIYSQLKTSDFIGKKLFDVYPEIVSNKLDHYYNLCLQGQPTILPRETHEYLIQLQSHYVDYKYMQQNVLIAPLINGDKIAGTITVIEDITDRVTRIKCFDEKIFGNIRAREEWEMTFDAVPDLIAIIDRHYRILRINKSMAERLGVKPQDIIGKYCYEIVHNTSAPPFFCPHHRLLENGQTHSVDIYEDNLKGFFNVTVVPFYGPDKKIISSVHITRDISEQVRNEQLLKSLSLIDDLTGLYNRRGFMALMEQLINTSNRLSCKMLVLFIDLNDMKFINDTFGHLEGDQALKGAASILRNTFRESDVIGRYGGDEFIVSAMQTGEIDYDTIIMRLNENADLHNSQTNKIYRLSFSIGISVYDPETPVSLEELISEADLSMYKYKQMLRLKNENI